MEYLKATILFLLFTSEIGLAERHLVPITLQSSHYKSFRSFSSDKYSSMHDAMEQWEGRRVGNPTSKTLKSAGRYTSTLVLPIKGSTIAIETKTSQVVVVMGSSDPYQLENLLLDLHPSVTILSVTSHNHENVIPHRMRRRWRWINATTTNNAITALDNAIQSMKVKVDTVVLGAYLIGSTQSSMPQIDYRCIVTLLEHFSGTVHQYIVFSYPESPTPFHSIREMKRLFHSYGYTHSRIENDMFFCKE